MYLKGGTAAKGRTFLPRRESSAAEDRQLRGQQRCLRVRVELTANQSGKAGMKLHFEIQEHVP